MPDGMTGMRRHQQGWLGSELDGLFLSGDHIGEPGEYAFAVFALYVGSA